MSRRLCKAWWVYRALSDDTNWKAIDTRRSPWTGISYRAMDKLIASIAVRAFYAITFLFMTGIVSTLIIIIPFKCPVLLPLYFLYALWLWVDYETPFKGGRPLKHCYLQRWRLVDLIRQYFPIKLVKTAELDASKNYLFGYHPHGMIPEGALVCFHTKFAGFQQLFPCIYPRVSMVSCK